MELLLLESWALALVPGTWMMRLPGANDVGLRVVVRLVRVLLRGMMVMSMMLMVMMVRARMGWLSLQRRFELEAVLLRMLFPTGRRRHVVHQ